MLTGGAGLDRLNGGGGADDMSGGTDPADSRVIRSTTQRARRNLSIDLDDVADDGEAGEGDNVHGDVETVTGGSGNNVIAGNAGHNVLRRRGR